MKTKKITLFILLIFGLLFAFQFLCLNEFIYKVRGSEKEAQAIETELVKLAAHSLLSEDVPVGAIVLYKNEILGTGYNTVKRDSVAYGHAEINALNACIKKVGADKFFELDRNELELITTLEPCQMCKGAIVEYRIKKVKFMMTKDFSYWFKENRWELLYQFKKRQIKGARLQDSLLHLHPKYND